MTPRNTPFVYVLWHLYLEPLCALAGVYQLHFMPRLYFSFMPSTSIYSSASQITYDQLASCYLFFAFIEGVLLRVVDDERIWRWIVFGLLLSDLGHCYAAWSEMGTEGILSAWAWRGKDGVTNWSTVLPVLVRSAYLVRLGVPGTNTGKRSV